MISRRGFFGAVAAAFVAPRPSKTLTLSIDGGAFAKGSAEARRAMAAIAVGIRRTQEEMAVERVMRLQIIPRLLEMTRGQA